MERGRGRLRGKETFQMFSSFTAAAALFLIYNSLMGLSWTEKHEKKSYHQRRHSAAVAPSNLYYYYCHLLSNSSLLPFFLRNCAWKTANLGKIEGEDREQTKNLLRQGKIAWVEEDAFTFAGGSIDSVVAFVWHSVQCIGKWSLIKCHASIWSTGMF